LEIKSIELKKINPRQTTRKKNFTIEPQISSVGFETNKRNQLSASSHIRRLRAKMPDLIENPIISSLESQQVTILNGKKGEYKLKNLEEFTTTIPSQESASRTKRADEFKIKIRNNSSTPQETFSSYNRNASEPSVKSYNKTSVMSIRNSRLKREVHSGRKTTESEGDKKTQTLGISTPNTENIPFNSLGKEVNKSNQNFPSLKFEKVYSVLLSNQSFKKFEVKKVSTPNIPQKRALSLPRFIKIPQISHNKIERSKYFENVKSEGYEKSRTLRERIEKIRKMNITKKYSEFTTKNEIEARLSSPDISNERRIQFEANQGLLKQSVFLGQKEKKIEHQVSQVFPMYAKPKKIKK